MTGLRIAAIVAAGLLAGPAVAQYGGIAGGGYGGFGDRPDYGGPPPARRYGPPDGPAARFGRSGGVCVTPNGECFAGGAPPGAPCGCTIPGFGRRRGTVE